VSVSLQELIIEHVADQAARWYPELAGPVQIGLRTLSDRPSCSLYVVRVQARDGERRVLAKVRRPAAGAGTARPVPAPRPRLRTDVAGVEELTVHEHAGLRAMVGIAAVGPGTFDAVRPLGMLPGQATLLMDYVDARTLRAALHAESRLLPSWLPRLGAGAAPHSTWQNVGTWLRTFHDRMPAQSLPARQETRDCVAERFDAYDGFLTEHVGRRVVGQTASRGAALAAEVLPVWLPLAVGHGDFAPRNMFIDEHGRVAVFDPMPRWRVPRHEDLCRFLVGLRLLGLQVHTRGAAYGAAELGRREDAVLRGYFGPGNIPRDEVRCYQLLIVLDKWSALVDSAAGGHGPVSRARAAGQRVANTYIRDEAARLLSHATAPAGA